MKYCAIVDGFSTGKFYPKYLKKAGYQCIHIQSTATIPKVAKNSFNAADYVAHYFFNGSATDLLTSLSKYSIEFVIPGSETGVELADALSTAFNRFPNEVDCGKRCRNKFLTGETLRKKGVRSVQQQKITNVEEALIWARQHRRWPIIIKPLNSGGGDGFFICHNEAELTKAVKSVIGSLTIFNQINDTILIQEFIEGTEYAVNTISYNGQHYVESFNVYEKRKLWNGCLVYETINLINSFDCSQADQLFQYTFDVLDALGFKYGATHNEIILTSDGPILMECNARVMGHTMCADLLTESLGYSQIELAVLMYTSPKRYEEHVKKPFLLKKYLTVVNLISEKKGIVQSIDFMDEIKKLPSFHSYRLYRNVDDPISETHDLPTSPGDVFLLSENQSQVREDIKKVREYERRGIFKIYSD